MRLSDIQALLDVNIRSAIIAYRSAIPHLPASERIINIGSSAADSPRFPGLSIYTLTKASLVGLTRGLARDQLMNVKTTQYGYISQEIH
jgi:3-oxoacyl-[acyl-carrier protein] reductase